MSQREAVAGLCAAAGVDPVAVGTVPHAVLRAAGLGMPMMRELEEVRHQITGPFVVDTSAATATFGIEAAPLEKTWQATVDWWRSRA